MEKRHEKMAIGEKICTTTLTTARKKYACVRTGWRLVTDYLYYLLGWYSNFGVCECVCDSLSAPEALEHWNSNYHTHKKKRNTIFVCWCKVKKERKKLANSIHRVKVERLVTFLSSSSSSCMQRETTVCRFLFWAAAPVNDQPLLSAAIFFLI